MSSLRPELHVAQQLRRDKLRIQHLQEFPNNLEQLSLHPGYNLDLLQVRNVRNGGNMLDVDEAPPLYPSEMITSFSSTPNPLSAPPRNTFECHEPQPQPEPTRLMMPPPSHHHYGSFPQSSSNNIHSSPKEHLGNWRRSGPHQVSDWMVNYANTSSVANESNPNSFLASELNNVSPTNNHHYGKPSCNVNVLTDVQSSPPPPLYHNALQDIFKSPNAHGSEMASLIQHGIWGGNTNEPLLHGDNQFRFGNANLWTNRGVGNSTTPLGFTDKKISNELQNTSHVLSDCNPQGLSLSLSSNSQSKPSSNFEQGTATATEDPQYSKSIMKPSIVSRDCGKSLHQDHPLGTPSGYRNVGPLGPFTGYATILKSSRFLKPCQQLLDECCRQCGKKFGKSCDVPEWVSREASVISTCAAESGVAAKGSSNSGGSSSMLYVSKENSADGGAGSSNDFCLSSRPGCQKNKAKLLYMQEEVSRRYKQYHQQMQMVVSSFESVAGLSSATPYVSLALKSVSRHFRCLKNAILDQLKLTCEVLGEDFSVIPSTSPSSKIDNNIARLRSMDQSYKKNKSGGGNIDFLESQQHVWRPQRGLPERSVAILKAWLFEHFLHPYPTDTDKHMLATQTGLSRNQVSNWFINARVRVWKPMVEEIHMLETKGMTEAHKNEGASASEGSSSHQPRVDQPVSKFVGTNAISEKQFQCLEMGSSSAGTNEEKGTNEEQWNQEKRSKLECEITPSMDGTMMGFMPYRRGGLEVGGLGSVSLTLGLRHGVEGVQHLTLGLRHGVEGVQHQQLQHEEDFRRQFGGHMIHDFVG